MYTIEIYYRTGNTFGSEDITERLELEWEDREKAEQALNDIVEHHTTYMITKNEVNAGKEDMEKIMKKARKQSWFTNDRYFTYSLLLENDDGERVDQNTFGLASLNLFMG